MDDVHSVRRDVRELSGDQAPRPSKRAAELIRAAAQRLIAAPEPLFAEVDAAVLATSPRLAADPVLAEAVSRSNRANLLHWASCNLADPGGAVAPNVGPETLDIALDVVRRGLDDAPLNAYRVGQNVAWRHWMDVAFELSEDPRVLHEMLDVTARTTARFVDGTIAAIQEQTESERERLAGRTHAERMQTVNLIVEGAPITRAVAAARLGYELARTHVAAVLWAGAGAQHDGQLERAAAALAGALHARGHLTLPASASSMWAWYAGAGEPAAAPAAAALARAPGVRAALGSPAAGLEGFRRSHLEALAVQRLMHRAPGAPALARHVDVRMVSLAASDQQAAQEFVARTLGALAAADAALRETVRTYIRERFSATRAARALYTHRNTVLNRLARARELLPRELELERNGLEVGLALELQRWIGPA